MIKGKCITQLDDYDCPVEVFARVPNIGERVHVRHRGMSTTLKVVQIVHDVRGPQGQEQPFIYVELHL